MMPDPTETVQEIFGRADLFRLPELPASRGQHRSVRCLEPIDRDSFGRQHGGEVDREYGAAAWSLVDINPGPVHRGDTGDDRQPESGIPAAATVAAPEALKDVLAIGSWDPRAAIHHANDTIARHGNFDGCPGSGVGKRIFHKISHGANERVAIAAQPHRAPGASHRYGLALR
jgi:hypothetical protein